MAASRISTYDGLLEALAKGGSRSAIAISRTGLPSAMLVSLARHYGASTQRVCRWVGITPATADRKMRNQAMLSPEQAERLTRIALLEHQATEAFGSRSAALRWMKTPSLVLAAESPIEMTDTSFGFDAVRRVLSSIQYGGAA